MLAEDGVIPAAAAKDIASIATVSAARVAEIEAEVKHDVIAFTTAVAETMKGQGLDGQSSRWLHYGLTSNDIVDTAQALQVKEASAMIRTGLLAFWPCSSAAPSSSSTRRRSGARMAFMPSPQPLA